MKVRALETWDGPTTARPRPSQFKATWTATRNLLQRELDNVNASDVVLELSTEPADLRNDGWPRAAAQVDSPVRISFNSPHGVLVYQADRFDRWQDNVRAVALALEALRKINRYGISDSGQQYAGWAQLEATASSPSARLELLASIAGIDPERADNLSSEEIIRAAKRATHPDAPGGSDAAFRQVMELSA